ncbi:hypothetical protein [Rhodobacter viridis]|uniref:hypothetical protein n=1 Tax=Rhodobacter viridis TaxID=1054202 RepID=UPI0011B3E636|nr:hypothetical protein [Rhodobacter viridis]
MPSPGTLSPALSDAVLRETLDLLGEVVANMSARLDAHGQILEEVRQASKASCAAALEAKTHTDPHRYAQHIGQEVYDALGDTIGQFRALQAGFATDREAASINLDELVTQEEHVLQRLRDDLRTVRRLKRALILVAFFGLVLVLGLAVVLAYFATSGASPCTSPLPF